MWPLLFTASIAALPALHFWWARRYDAAVAAAERRIEELTLRQHQFEAHALAEQRALFNSMIEGVLVLDKSGRIRLANRAVKNLVALPEDLSGKTILETFRMHELEALVSRLCDQKQVLGFELSLPGIEKRTVEVNATAVISAEGSQEGTILVFHDLTRIKKLENTRQEFVANVSHELRTPLALIKGYVETLLDGAKDKPEVAARFLQTIERNADRLSLLIEDLLTISRLESGQAMMNFAPVNLRAAVDRVLEDLQPRAAEKQVSLTNAVPETLCGRADADRLHQVLYNLVDNAIKYGRAGGSVRVDARALESERKVELCVQDDGPGIPSNALERIFERFYRVDKARSRDQGGTGLGLSIVKHIVQSHGGKVWVTSQAGAGSDFYFTLDNVTPASEAKLGA